MWLNFLSNIAIWKKENRIIILEKFMANWEEILIDLGQKENVVFSTSFSLEDQIITDFIAKNHLKIEIFTIDTGRLFNESYEVWQRTLDKYDLEIKSYYPNQYEIEDFVKINGINAFYNSVSLRKKCCHIRKIEPLKRALKNKNFWISGIRKEHSQDRSKKKISEFDDNLKIKRAFADPVFFAVKDFGKTEQINETLEKINVNDYAEILFLTKYIGDYNVTKFGKKTLTFENKGYTLVVERL